MKQTTTKPPTTNTLKTNCVACGNHISNNTDYFLHYGNYCKECSAYAGVKANQNYTLNKRFFNLKD